MTIPRATARLQFHKDFTLDDGAKVVDYYAALGTSHFYASPIFAARTGSTHGYDIVDPTRINPELGGEPALRRLVEKLRAAGMGLIIDIVPNHMGVAESQNPWWQDVLEWGQESPYAGWFDIDWNRMDAALRGKVLLPFLGDQYGNVLDSGDLALQFDAEAGKFFIGYHAHRFPVAPADYPAILYAAHAAVLAPAIAVFSPGDERIARHASAGAFARLRDIAATPEGRAAVDAGLARFSTAETAGRDALHRLLERQHYRLAWWRYAADGINWRRFFEVTELAGIRVERDDVFDTTHALTFRLYEEGLIDGVRVDHVDGLADPGGYCRRLRAGLEARTDRRPAGAPRGRPYIVVEKILASDEALRQDWEVDGTTGYDFMDQVGALLHYPGGASQLNALWTELTGRTADFEAEVRAARRQLLSHNLAAEFNAATRAVLDLARADLHARDYSLNAIRRVYAELLLGFPVYRTYVRDGGRDAHDRDVFARAMDQARRRVYSTDLALLEHLDAWLGGRTVDDASDEATRDLQRRAIRRFQQLTPPLAAKSVEDTAFYRYGRLLSRNEVGADPGEFSLSLRDFHAACAERARTFPDTMLATATHDHKRGEDVTARLAVLSELARDWGQSVRNWMTLNAPLRAEVPDAAGVKIEIAPRPADELMLYQMLAGAWPIGLDAFDADGVRAFADRIWQWQNKALREAKAASNWVEPNERYEEACRDFLFAILENRPGNAFLAELSGWVRRVTPAGAVNSFTQTLLRLTTPGVPDLYQGTEFWDFSLVDPDNRRPVDFAAREKTLREFAATPPAQTPWQSGALKQRLIHAALACRARLPDLFARGSYEPLACDGPKGGMLVAFLRRHGDTAMIVIATRFPVHAGPEETLPTIPAQSWAGTSLAIPGDAGGRWADALTGAVLIGGAGAGGIDVAQALATLPMALLVRDRK